MSAATLIGYLLGAYALGWVWGKTTLAFKQFMEKTI